MTRPLAVLFVVLAAVGSARADGAKPTFDEDVAPVLRQHCAACHNNDKQRGGLNLSTFAVTMEGGSSGVVVTAGDADKSRLFTMTAHKEEPVMPPSKTKIPDAQLDILKKWVEQGARENAGSKIAVAVKPKVDLGLKAVTRGKPDGPPPMPLAGKLSLDPVVRTRRAGAVLALAASPWAPLVAVGGQKQVLLYHADTGDLVGVLPFEHGQINAVKFSRNAKFVLAAGGRGGASGKAVLYAVDTGAKVAEVGSAETDAILAADLSADQTLIAVGTTSRLVRVYQVSDGAVLSTVKKHTDWVTAVEFSPDGVLLATGDRAGGGFVWESATAREFHVLRGHTAQITDVSWRADSNLLATAGLDGTARVWEMENGRQVKQWAAHPGGAEGVRFTPAGQLATTGRDKLTKLWDANGGLQKQFPAHGDIGLRVAVSHDSTKVVSGDWAGSLSVWTAADAKPVAVFDTNPAGPADQLKLAEQAAQAADAACKQAQAAHDVSQAGVTAKQLAHDQQKAAATKLTSELAAAQKAATDQAAAVAKLTPQAAAAKADADKLAAAVGPLLARHQSLEVTAVAFAQAAKQVQDAAGKAPMNAELAAAAKAADALAKQHAADRDATQKAHAAAVTAGQTAAAKHQAAAKAVADAQAAGAAAQKRAGELPAQVKAATDTEVGTRAARDAAAKAAEPARQALDGATQALAAAKAKAERLKGAVAAKK